MTLTAEQQEVIRRLCPNGPQASGDQTPDQALNLAVLSVLAVCEFDGIPAPSEADVRAALEGADGGRSWTPKPLDVGDGPIGEEESIEAEIEAARRNWEQMDPETRAEVERINRSAALAVARALSEGHWVGKLDQMAADAHRAQTDKQGVPYIEHVRAVADSVSDEARPVALFHDALEDTPLTPEELKAALIEPKIMTPEEAQAVVDAVKLLTHDNNVDSYEQYVENVRTAPGKAGALAREVKRADLQHNLGRLTPELERLRARYVGALELLG